MQFEVDRERDVFGEPSLLQMVEKALGILQNAPDGYVLFVEGKIWQTTDLVGIISRLTNIDR